MKTLLKTLSCSLLLSASLSAQADWNASAGYSNLNTDIESADVSLGVIYGSVGYTYTNGNMTYMPELRVGFGIDDDTVYGVDLEVDSLIVASVRAQYNVKNNIGIFVQPSYARLEATASAGGQSFTENDWEFGIGGGATVNINEQTSVEALYEVFDDTDVFSVGVRYHF